MSVIPRPIGIGAFEFAVLAALRATQLTRGCLPRVAGDHTVAITAQLEIAHGTVIAVSREEPSHATAEV